MEYPELKTAMMEGAWSDKQLKEMKAVCDIRLGNFSEKESALKELDKSESDTYPMLFHGRLANTLKMECGIVLSPYFLLKKTNPKYFRQLCKVTNHLYAISEEWNKSRTRSRKFAIGVFHLYCELVVEYLQGYGVPVSPTSCLQHVEKFLGMVDKQFPGYVRSGTISMVILRDI